MYGPHPLSRVMPKKKNNLSSLGYLGRGLCLWCPPQSCHLPGPVTHYPGNPKHLSLPRLGQLPFLSVLDIDPASPLSKTFPLSFSLEQFLNELKISKTEARSERCSLRYKPAPHQDTERPVKKKIQLGLNTDYQCRSSCHSCTDPFCLS